MNNLSQFNITKRWPANHPDRIQLYSLPTPNGVKVSIALEELELAYEAHLVSFSDNDQMTPEYLSLNPNNKIPSMIDPNGPDGKPLSLWESGAILVYLAEKEGKLLPQDPAARYQCLQWLMFQMGGVGPMFGQFGHFYKFAADKVANNPYPGERYREETRRLLGVLNTRLDGHDYLAADQYTIADIAVFPWVKTLIGFYDARQELGFDDFPNVERSLEKFLARPAVERGSAVPSRV